MTSMPMTCARMEGGAGLLAGEPVAAISLRIVRDQWGKPVGPLTPDGLDAITLAAGEVGEIVVSGEHVLTGYLGGIGDSETKVHVGGRVWHRTGDAGYRDRRGRLWLLGRCSAKIGEPPDVLYPFAVETAALTVDGIERCALVEHDGARILVVQLARGAAADTVPSLHAATRVGAARRGSRSGCDPGRSPPQREGRLSRARTAARAPIRQRT